MEEYRVLVLYRSKHGTTKRYAEWIADALDADIISAENRTYRSWSEQLNNYDMLIYGGNINGQGINGLENFRAAMRKGHIDRPVTYFCVGSYPAYESTIQTHLEMNFVGEDDLSKINLFYFRGRLDFLGMTFLEKRLMGGLFKAIEKKYPEDRTEAESELLEAYYDDVDWSKKEYIDPLVDHVKSFMTQEQLAYLEPRAAANIAEREELEAEEAEAWDAEMKRREALYHENKRKDEERMLRRMSRKQRQRYLERKAFEAALTENEEDLRILEGGDLPEEAPEEMLSETDAPAEAGPEEFSGEFPAEEEDEYAEFREFE
ncbi:MAG: hypothetical protein IJG57_01250 [Firmicutes bacterium]|nr:hypothetical protein [Bacillota bacterium]